jgi:lysozyme
MLRQVTPNLLQHLANLIHGEEGCKLTSYLDQGGVWTIGWGHTQGVSEGMTCTQEQANAWFQENLHDAEGYVQYYVHVLLNDNQFAALVSLVYNIGAGNFSHSTLLKDLNNNDFADAASQFLVWDLVDGEKNAGLSARRHAEQALFLTPME